MLAGYFVLNKVWASLYKLVFGDQLLDSYVHFIVIGLILRLSPSKFFMPFERWYNLFYLLVAPKINLSSRREYYIEGSNVTIACEAFGEPLPDVAWIRNGVLASSGNKAALLKFNNMNRMDAGQYTCRANNSVEVTTIDTTIVVHCKYILT